MHAKCIRIPDEKRNQIRELIEPYIRGKVRTIDRKLLERYTGKLNHIADALWQGRALVRSGYDVLRVTPDHFRSARISGDLRADWRRLYDILADPVWAPLELVSPQIPLKWIDYKIFTDACLTGWGATCNDRLA